MDLLISSVGFNTLKKQRSNSSSNLDHTHLSFQANQPHTNPLARLFTRNRSVDTLSLHREAPGGTAMGGTAPGGNTSIPGGTNFGGVRETSDEESISTNRLGRLGHHSMVSLPSAAGRTTLRFRLGRKKAPDLTVQTNLDAEGGASGSNAGGRGSSTVAALSNKLFHRRDTNSGSSPLGGPLSPLNGGMLSQALMGTHQQLKMQLMMMGRPSQDDAGIFPPDPPTRITFSSNNSNLIVTDPALAITHNFVNNNDLLGPDDLMKAAAEEREPHHSSLFDIHRRLMLPTDHYIHKLKRDNDGHREGAQYSQHQHQAYGQHPSHTHAQQMQHLQLHQSQVHRVLVLLGGLYELSVDTIGLGITPVATAEMPQVDIADFSSSNGAFFVSLLGFTRPLFLASQYRKLSLGVTVPSLGFAMEDVAAFILDYWFSLKEEPMEEILGIGSPYYNGSSGAGTTGGVPTRFRMPKRANSLSLIFTAAMANLGSSPTLSSALPQLAPPTTKSIAGTLAGLPQGTNFTVDHYKLRAMMQDIEVYFTKGLTILFQDTTLKDAVGLINRLSLLTRSPTTATVVHEWARLAHIWDVFNTRIRYYIVGIFVPVLRYTGDTEEHLDIDAMVLRVFREVCIDPIVGARAHYGCNPVEEAEALAGNPVVVAHLIRCIGVCSEGDTKLVPWLMSLQKKERKDVNL